MNRIVLTRTQALLAALALLLAGSVFTLAATGNLALLQSPGGGITLPTPGNLARQRVLQDLMASPEFDRLLEVVELIRTRYVREEVDLDTLLVGAAKGAVEALGDPYSFYFDARELEDFEISMTGEYTGIGVRVQEKDGFVVVVAPFPGSPGATTPFEGAGPGDPPGLRRGDRIVEVDGRDVVGLPVELVARMIRGPAGTEVRLRVLRDAEEGTRELRFVIRRARIEIPTVDHKLLPDGTGYLRIHEFLPQAAARAEEALADLQARGMRALVLDLRDNPGGRLDAVRGIADLFLADGPVAHVEYRGGQRETLKAGPGAFEVPLVVLVNRGSASASEILAGALRDRLGAPLVGEKTFGKGSVQSTWTFGAGGQLVEGEGRTGLKLTTARWLTPAGTSLDGVGLVPDVEVPWEGTEGMGDPARDPQLRRALEVLRARRGG